MISSIFQKPNHMANSETEIILMIAEQANDSAKTIPKYTSTRAPLTSSARWTDMEIALRSLNTSPSPTCGYLSQSGVG
jgi:hypothetical protein